MGETKKAATVSKRERPQAPQVASVAVRRNPEEYLYLRQAGASAKTPEGEEISLDTNISDASIIISAKGKDGRRAQYIVSSREIIEAAIAAFRAEMEDRNG